MPVAATSGMPVAGANGIDYRPGTCNIGPAEIARRRRAGHVGLGRRYCVRRPGRGGCAAAARSWSPFRRPSPRPGTSRPDWFCAGSGPAACSTSVPSAKPQQVVDPDAQARDRAKSTTDRPGEPRHRHPRRCRRRTPPVVSAQSAVTPEAARTVDRVERVAAVLRSHNIEAIVVESGAEAREAVLGMIPEGAEVHSGKSKTLEDVGLYADLIESGRYDAIRPRYVRDGSATQGREIRKLIAAPDFMLGSVAAVTDDGVLVAASATGSQLGPYVAGRRPPDPRRRQPEDRAGPRRGAAADRRRRLPLGERPGSGPTGRGYGPREGPAPLRRVAGRPDDGRARPRAGRRLNNERAR